MSEAVHSHLEGFPEGAIEAFQGRIQGFNHAAQSQFPELAVGEKLPAFLTDSFDGPEGAGSFSHNGVLYLFSRISGCRRELLLFRPASQAALTDRQLDGFIRQMRGFLQEILMEVEAVSNGAPSGLWAFYKSFCRTYRLLSNLEFVHSMGSGEGVLFRPTTLDLAGLCRSLTREAGDLLGEAGVKLRFICPAASLLIPGDPALLQRLIFSLLSNAAKAAPEGEIVLSLASRGGRAVLTLGDSGALKEGDLDALFPPEQTDGQIPGAGEGAGMGLAIARHIVALHKGVMLLEQRESGLFAAISLPTGPLSPRLTVQSPTLPEGPGFSPAVVELSDVLPASLFRALEEE